MSNTHLIKIEHLLRTFPDIDTYRLETQPYPANIIRISRSVTFKNGHQLAFTEIQRLKVTYKTKYRYQYMDEKQIMIFRYDNAEHHLHLSNFPHHKHTATKIIASTEPELQDVLIEIAQILHKSG